MKSFLTSDQSFALVSNNGEKSLVSYPLTGEGHGILVRDEVNGKFRLVGGDIIVCRQLNARVVKIPENYEVVATNGDVQSQQESPADYGDISPKVAGILSVISVL